ncbi:hypothetical protein [Lysobacter sp. cf310]|uniref:hypothetical protein n=1 Tax=Lysobacter sp. cf310 TaxID=1761790 RepID=UPI0008E88097|nr:hypothetical protein [Lysobacter sp. cf310]SFK90614.1 hypothetical protein SAMN04487938_2342 [Lysobacter sp. cf310]
MNSKLHNSISALLVSGATLVLALVAANPALPDASSVAPPRVAAVVAPLPLDAAAIVRRAEAQAQRIEARAQQVENLADVAALTAEVATAVALANALENASAAEPADDAVPHRKARKATRRNRQALVMPYFSFAPRG